MWVFWLCSGHCLGCRSQDCTGTVPDTVPGPCRCSWVFGQLLPCRNVSSFPLNPSTLSIFPRTPRVQQQGAPRSSDAAWLSISHITSVPASVGPLDAPSRQGSGWARQELIKHHHQLELELAVLEGNPLPTWLVCLWGASASGESQSTVLTLSSSFKYLNPQCFPLWAFDPTPKPE